MNVAEFLQQKIQDYKKSHPRTSSAQLARMWGLSTSSLNRLENQETKRPSVEQALRVLRGCGLRREISSVLPDYYPELREFEFQKP
jgi:hypothetical protein